MEHLHTSRRYATHLAVVFAWLLILTCLGCDENQGEMDAGDDADVSEDVGPGDDADVTQDAGLSACEPALALRNPPAFASPHALLTLVPEGGTGNYRFEFVTNASGGNLDNLLGIYVPGGANGVTDEIRLTDTGCIGELTHTIQITDNMVLRPSLAVVRPANSFTFEVGGGSGTYAFELTSTQSGGTLDPTTGVYTAGASEGRDRVRVTDTATGRGADAVIDVQIGADLEVSTARLVIPLNATSGYPVQGGSGEFEGVSADPSVLMAGTNLVSAVAMGSTTIQVRDRFLGWETTINAEVIAPAHYPVERTGDFLGFADFASGDINGDGYEDVVFALAESDYHAANSGAVFILEGTAEGLNTTPIWTFASRVREARTGSAIALKDFDNDGHLDLAVASYMDLGLRTQSGTVSIFHGREGMFFSLSPQQVISGANSNDRIGFDMTACDFNADGYLDLAVSGIDAEDRSTSTRYNSQGAVLIYLGRADGFSDTPQDGVYGETYLDGMRVPVGSINLGYSISSGDINGDGACDLVAMLRSPWRSLSRNNDGALMVYAGIAASDSSAGGVTANPVRAIVGRLPDSGSSQTNASGYFGRPVEVADLDGDGNAEIIAGHASIDIDGRTDTGKVWVIQGGDFPSTEPTDFELVDDVAAWSNAGDYNYDNVGRGLAVADIDGDGQPELLSGDYTSEDRMADPVLYDSGLVRVWRAAAGASFDLTAVGTVSGPNNGDRFGFTLGAVGTNGLFGYAIANDVAGYDVGTLYFIPRDTSSTELLFGTPQAIELPGYASNARFGHAVAIVGDVTGNGRADLLSTAPYAEIPELLSGRSWGVSVIHEGTDDGFDLSRTHSVLHSFVRHSSGDQSGWAASAAGDFDNDSRPDFAIVNWLDDRPNNSSDYVEDTSCDGSRSDSGSVTVFRGVDSGTTITEASFIIHGPYRSARIESIAGGFDANNDGFDDLVIGGWRYSSNRGYAALILGRAATPGQVIELCPDQVWDGEYNNQNYGRVVSFAGDIDGDGCDDIAVGIGSYGTETSNSGNRGAVDIRFGTGTGCGSSNRRVRLISSVTNANAGRALAGGQDLDGDGIPDLVVGGPNHRIESSPVGRVWAVRGAYIRDLLSMGGSLPTGSLLEPDQTGLVLDGSFGGGELGYAVAMLAPVSVSANAAIAVGVPNDMVNGTNLVGSVRVHQLRNIGGAWEFDPTSLAFASGETRITDGRFGAAIASGPAGRNNRPTVAIGAEYGSGLAETVQFGSVYTFQP